VSPRHTSCVDSPNSYGGTAILRRLLTACALGAAAVVTLWAAAQPGGPLPQPFPLFPPSYWWNTDITSAPIDPRSDSFIAFINNGGTRRLHPDLGGDAGAGAVYGFPYVVVDGTQAKKTVQFVYADESDGVDHVTGLSVPFYPIPDEAVTQPGWIEGGPPGNVDLRSGNDRHLLIVDRDNRCLYELYNVFYDGAQWHAGSGAFFDMTRSDRRPAGWTSADAAGLAILPGLVRYDEVSGPDEIGHAFRVTVRASNGYVYPASHAAGSNASALPMGARLRLKAGVDLSRFPAEAQKIFRAMKKYGLIVADNGSDMYVSGTYDVRWNNDILNPAFGSLAAGDFEVVQLGWIPPPPPPPTFTDDPLIARVTVVKALHLAELRQRVGELRGRYGLGATAWTDDPPAHGVTPIRAVHLAELRTALAAVYTAAGRTPPSWSPPSIAGGATVVTAAQIAEIRSAILAIW
jgi:hypothetical protein